MILDTILPDMDGLELVDRLRSDPKTSHIPLLLFSCDADPEFVQRAYAYGYRPRGASLVVMKLDELGDANAMFRSVTIPVGREISDDLVEGAKLFMSPQGKVQPIASAKSLLVIDYPDRVGKIRQFVESLEGGPSGQKFVSQTGDGNISPQANAAGQSKVIYFSPQFVKAASIKEAIESILTSDARVTVIEDENRLVVVDKPEGLALARQAIEQLDTQRPQVRITAFIYDVNLEEMERLGVNWNHAAQSHFLGGAPQNVFGLNSTLAQDPSTQAAATTGAAVGTAVGTAVNSTVNTATGGILRFSTMHRNVNFSSVINMLDQTSGARLLADPSVTVVDREQASIKVVTEIPYQQLTQTQQGGNIGTTDFREAGITLNVTPQISQDGTIQMKVAPSFSVLTGFTQGQPIIDSREADTTVRVANGQVLVIGGLRQRTENEVVGGLPGLKDIKHFGKLFRTHETTVTESELVVFLKPEIVTPVSFGKEREMTAHMHGTNALDRIPFADDCEFIPYCHDKNCPYHHPRPRTNPGSSSDRFPIEFEELPHAAPNSQQSSALRRDQPAVVYVEAPRVYNDVCPMCGKKHAYTHSTTPPTPSRNSRANGNIVAQHQRTYPSRKTISKNQTNSRNESPGPRTAADWFKDVFHR